MKWDIWSAEYPFQMLMSDALDNHTLPLWNPLMRYGTPQYAMVGSPVWYPFTMLLALFGYTPRTIAVSYAMHIAIAGYGMFLLTREEIRVNTDGFSAAGVLTSVIAGLLYCGSGLFCSNAQHIMIIISAAWIPYVLYFVQRYLKAGKLVYGMAAGACAAMILLGGYPQMFYELFLVLIPYTLYFNHCFHYFGNRKRTAWIGNSAWKYCSTAIFTVLASAVTLFPFLANMSSLSRTSGLGQIPELTPFRALFSFFLPGASYCLPSGEVSMNNFYVGLIVLLLLPAAVCLKNSGRKLYYLLAAGSFFMCWGENSFLYTLIYRFFPMYSTFRFPELNRVFFAIFIILCAVPAVSMLMDQNISGKTLRWAKILFAIMAGCAAAATFAGSFLNEDSGVNLSLSLNFGNAAFISAVLLAIWLIVFYLGKNRNIQKKTFQYITVCAVCAELLTFALIATPLTVASYSPLQYSYDTAVQKKVNKEFTKNKKRNRDINFAGNRRSTNGLKSKTIVFDRTFDEEGYVSFRLQKTDEFLTTYHRSIIEQNPVAYFTNNVINKEDMSYAEWAASCAVPPEQIFADQPVNTAKEESTQFHFDILRADDLEVQFNGNMITVDGPIGSTGDATGRIRLYYEEMQEKSIPLNITFITEDGTEWVCSGDYLMREEDGSFYIDVYFPKVFEAYQKAEIVTEDRKPVSAQLIVLDRMSKDEYVDVYDFGFNSIGMNVNAPTEGYMVLLQNKHDGWTAYVDGEEQEISLVDNCFMGIHLQQGEHSIVMRFRPKEFFAGAAVTVLYFCTLLVVLVRFVRKSVHSVRK